MVLPVVSKHHPSLSEWMSLCILLRELRREKWRAGQKMSLSLGVSSVPSALAKQLSNTDALACGPKLSSGVSGEGEDSMTDRENFFCIRGNLHDGKLCLPPNLTCNKL